jgi:hypothetical protein
MQAACKLLKSIIEVSHIEFQSYDLHRHQIMFSSGVGQEILGYTKKEFYELSRNFFEDLIYPMIYR